MNEFFLQITPKMLTNPLYQSVDHATISFFIFAVQNYVSQRWAGYSVSTIKSYLLTLYLPLKKDEWNFKL